MRECGELLWQDEKPVAVCTREYGTEHSHQDFLPTDMIRFGHARPISPDDVFRVVDFIPPDEFDKLAAELRVFMIRYNRGFDSVQERDEQIFTLLKNKKPEIINAVLRHAMVKE